MGWMYERFENILFHKYFRFDAESTPLPFPFVSEFCDDLFSFHEFRGFDGGFTFSSFSKFNPLDGSSQDFDIVG